MCLPVRNNVIARAKKSGQWSMCLPVRNNVMARVKKSG